MKISIQRAQILLSLCLTVSYVSLSGQTSDSSLSAEWKFTLNGFLKSDYWFDSREIIGARDNLVLLYPMRPVMSPGGEDISARSSFNFSAITSRLTGRINGPKAFGAKATGLIEADFSGISNADIDGFRLRHSYIELKWQRVSMLLGQHWHPMFVTEVFPNVLALNTGAPFQPFIRSPQISITYQIKNIKLIAAAMSQLDYASEGPKGKSPKYLSYSNMPNLHFQSQLKVDQLILGAAIDYKSLVPQINPIQPSQSESIGSFSLMAFARFDRNNISVKGKIILGENLTEHLMLGGYYARLDTSTGVYTGYRSTRHLNQWFNFTYLHKNWEFSTFIGYSKKIAGRESLKESSFGTGMDIDHCYRVSPMVAVTSGKVKFCFEAEYTRAAYESYTSVGEALTTDITNDPGNLRLQLTGFYFF